MIQDLLHNQICKYKTALEDWYKTRSHGLEFPIYSSFDIRDSGSKVTPVDANIFPAGFNNICDVDKENAPGLFKSYLEQKYSNIKSIVLLAEEHTSNAYYWENVYWIKTIIEEAVGFEVKLAWPKEMKEPIKVKSAHGHEMKVYGANKMGSSIEVDSFVPDLIINNNDFSSDYSEWLAGINLKTNPSYKLGWFWRRKDSFFENYNHFVTEFADIINVPRIHLNIKTENFKNFDINSPESRSELAGKVDQFISNLKQEYASADIQSEAFAFVKNSAGTYGLGVTKVDSGDEIRSWNNRTRTKMKAAKGGGGFNEVIIQEGIPTRYVGDYGTAEPAIYMVGDKLCGGFLRTHQEKSAIDSLNSPGAVYKRLCISDLRVDSTKCPQENVYGWVAKIGMLSIAKEYVSSQG